MPWFRIGTGRRIVRRRRVVRKATAKSKVEFKELAPLARTIAHERLAYFNQHYKLKYKKVFIRNTRTRWGTCSSLGNISFNYRIAKLPASLQDYVVVHELCHLAHMNHSKDFWDTVAETLPHWKSLRTQLRKHHLN